MSASCKLRVNRSLTRAMDVRIVCYGTLAHANQPSHLTTDCLEIGISFIKIEKCRNIFVAKFDKLLI